MRAPITLGLHMPNFSFPDVGPETLFERLVEIARTAEDAGFSSLTVMDHLHQIPGVGPPGNFMLEGNTILGALAGRTSHLTLGLLVGGVTYRNPALLAKMTTTLDVISGGRAILGLGAAWYEEEHEAYGFAFPPLKERFERLEEALRIARAMFTQERSSVEGTHYRTRDVLNNPRPPRGDIPIMVGGSGERKTLRLVAQYADACNVFGDVDRTRHLFGVLEGHCEAVGRDPAEITKTRMGRVFVGPTHEAGMAELDAARRAGLTDERVRTIAMAGDADELAEQAAAFAEAGVEGLTVSLPDASDLETVALVGRTLAPIFARTAG